MANPRKSAFKKGNPGRPKGAKGKINRELKEIFRDTIMQMDVEKLAKGLTKGMKIKLLHELAPYVLTKPDSNMNVKGDIHITVEFVDPDGEG